MKKIIMLLTAVLLISGISLAQAQTAARTPAGAQHEKQMGKWQGKALELRDELKLNDTQKAQITDILTQMYPQMKALREDTTMAAPDRMAKMKELRAATESQLDKVLTTDQRAKLDELRAKAMKEMQEMRKERQAAKTTPATTN